MQANEEEIKLPPPQEGEARIIMPLLSFPLEREDEQRRAIKLSEVDYVVPFESVFRVPFEHEAEWSTPSGRRVTYKPIDLIHPAKRNELNAATHTIISICKPDGLDEHALVNKAWNRGRMVRALLRLITKLDIDAPLAVILYVIRRDLSTLYPYFEPAIKQVSMGSEERDTRTLRSSLPRELWELLQPHMSAESSGIVSALTHFDKMFTEPEIDDMVLSAAMGLELLFSTALDELSFSTSLFAAHTAFDDMGEIRWAYGHVRNFYKLRSGIVHGQKRASPDDLPLLLDVVNILKVSIIRLLRNPKSLKTFTSKASSERRELFESLLFGDTDAKAPEAN